MTLKQNFVNRAKKLISLLELLNANMNFVKKNSNLEKDFIDYLALNYKRNA
jgi:hypothetical protein